MTAQMAQKLSEDNALGLYVHVPFCAKMCEFCAFYKERADRKKIDIYLDAIELELATWPKDRQVSTVFFGGGTPSLLIEKDLDRLCGAVKQLIGDHKVEWTIECAPNTLTEGKLQVLLQHGVNRFSLGVQSFSPRVLEAIGRPHTPEQTLDAIELLMANVKNWNIDLIFAAADSTLDEWKRDLTQAIEHNPKHISTYCLTFESDTAMYVKMMRGKKKRPSADEEARFYLETWKILREAGYHHYELANFARPGWECRHNLRTWHMHEWRGVGPGAASQLELRRWSNVADLESWAAGASTNQPRVTDEEKLTPHQLAVDALVFGLRLVDGVRPDQISRRFSDLGSETLAQLQEDLTGEGLLQVEDGVWKLTDEGLLVADAIGAEVAARC